MAETRTFVPMSDGVRLGVTLYLPETEPPWPVLMEARPYRKDDVTAYEVPEYRRLVAEGDFALCRVDVRGTGQSGGVSDDEYAPQEQRDLCEVIAWLAARDWSTGAVGMFGSSYSGFNALQLAMERPPDLKAIVAIYATDDRYTDDVSYVGGARRALDFVDYPLYMVAMNALPPWPDRNGPGWRERWRERCQERIESNEPWLLRWLEEQLDGPYWRHGSLRSDYEAIECPTFLVGGWADGYRNATLRVMERLRCPRRLLMGPWAHMGTENSLPGPHLDLVPEMVRWFDRWLRGADNGADRDPPITVFVRRSTRPAPDLAMMGGTWRHEPGWPLERGRERIIQLVDAAASGGRGDAGEDALEVRGDVGATASISCAASLPYGQPVDQRPDEAFSLGYEWPPLTEELEIMGCPRLGATVRSSAPVAFLSAKLCDVFPDGTSTLVSRGFLNLTHRSSSSAPEPLAPGRPYRVTVELDATSWVFEPGHRVRLDLAGTDWPNAWPPPEPVTLTVQRAGTWLVLPVVEGPPPIPDPPKFTRAPPAAPDSVGKVRPVWRLEHDVLGRESRVVVEHGAEAELEGGLRSTERYAGAVGVSTEDPGRAWAEGTASFTLAWPDLQVRSEARAALRSDRTTYHLTVELDVSEDGETRWSRRWERTYPRQLN